MAFDPSQPIIAFDSGTGRFYFYETSTGRSGKLSYTDFVSMSWLPEFPETRQLIVESAHLQPQRTSLAQPLTSDQLREFTSTASLNGVRIFTCPGEQRASRSFYVHGSVKKSDELDSEAIGRYYTEGGSSSDVKPWTMDKPVAQWRKALNREMTLQANKIRLHSSLPGYGITEADAAVDDAVRTALDVAPRDFGDSTENAIRDHILADIKGRVAKGKKMAVFSSPLVRALAITALDQRTGEPWKDDNGNEISLRDLRDIAWGDSASHGMRGVVRSDIFHWGLSPLWKSWSKYRDIEIDAPRIALSSAEPDPRLFDDEGDADECSQENACSQSEKLEIMQRCREFRVFRRVFRRTIRNLTKNIKMASSGAFSPADAGRLF